MRLLYKLALVLSVVALAPMAIFAVFGVMRTDEALRARIEAEGARTADQAATIASTRGRELLRSLSLYAGYADFGASSEEVLVGVLRVAYRQSDDITVVSLIDEQGRPAAESVYLEDPSRTESLRLHEAVSAEDLAEHGRHVPLDAALASGAAFGPPYGTPERPRISLAVEVAERREGRRLFLVAELSLASLTRDLHALEREGEELVLLDGEGRILGSRGEPVALPFDPSGGLPDTVSTGSFSDEGRRWLGAFAPVTFLGGGVLVRREEAVAFAPTARLRRQGMYWAGVGLLAALFLAFLVARDLSGRIRELGTQAEGIARGELETRVPVRSTDELGRLAESFNEMAGGLERQRDQIEEQHEEIRRWNEELEERVAVKTEELARAQEIVLRSRRLAGLGVLGAGVAHEINNPLASTLGYIQLLKMDKALGDDQRGSLVEAEKGALRIREIVADLLKLTDAQTTASRRAVEMSHIVRGALAMIEGAVEEKKVTLRVELEDDLPPVEGEPQQLTEVALHLLRNGVNAFDEPGTMTVRTSHTGGQVVSLVVEDSGRGIPKELLDRVFDPFFTTKEDWDGRGLGLSVAHKIVEDHGGRLDIESELGEGTTVTITLPVAAGSRHLA